MPYDEALEDTARTLTTPPEAIVRTSSGPVQGVLGSSIYTFKGIPYGADTGGEARFRAPKPPVPWTSVRPALSYGPCCPQVDRAGWASGEHAFLFDWDDGFAGEDCLCLNVWTPGPTGAQPVMLWIHGGGYEAGSAQELPAYDGANLARRGDVVVISLNHRLGPFGYLDLTGDLDGAVANPGMQDIVLALEWVRGNAAAFGGDAGNVTVFGQSGGGAKINTLMSMPSAKGLFHKAIVMSGSQLRLSSPARAREVTAAVLADAAPETLRGLTGPELVALGAAAATAVRAGPRPNGAGWDGMVWQPWVDGEVVSEQPYHPVPASGGHAIPLLVGGTLHESSPSIAAAKLEAMTWEDAEKRLSRGFGDRTGALIEAFRTAYPQSPPVEIAALIGSAGMGRLNPLKQARLKAQAGGAPAWLYAFGWKTPVLDGRPRAFHCSDLAFAFDNIDRCLNHTGGDAQARALAARMADAWIAFARHGDPNHSGLARWDPVTPDQAPTMIFDNVCRAETDPDKAALAAFG